MRGTRVRRMQRMMKDLGRLADNVSEVNVHDLDDLWITESISGRAVGLMLGDQQLRLALAEFYRPLSGHRTQDAGGGQLRSADSTTASPPWRENIMASKPQFAVGLDAGSASTRCRDLRAGEFAPALSRAWRSAFHGMEQGPPGRSRARCRQCIRAAVQRGRTRKRGISAEPSSWASAAAAWTARKSRGLYEFGRPREVTPEDMAYAVERACARPPGARPLLLHVLPQDFTLDGRAGYRKPQRQFVLAPGSQRPHCHRMSAQEHQCVVTPSTQAHFAVEETVFEPMAAAYACCARRGPHRGVAVLDIGAALDRSGGLRWRGAAARSQHSRVGRSLYPRRGVCFKVTYEDAECLKQQYGCALLGLTSDNSLIEVPSPEGRPPREAPPQRAERNSGSARRGVVLLCAAPSWSASAWSEAAGRHGAHRRRRAVERHVRHGGARA